MFGNQKYIRHDLYIVEVKVVEERVVLHAFLVLLRHEHSKSQGEHTLLIQKREFPVKILSTDHVWNIK